jgi:Bacterial SH3 domain
MPANYIEVALRRTLLMVTVLAIAGCSIGQQAGTPQPSSSAALISPQASGPLLLGIWVLSPVGLKLRDLPNTAGKELATIPQGAKLTATAKQGTDPPWYQVDYTGTKGWIAGRLPRSNPPIDLVSVHPQLSFSNGNGYYLLYPASWMVTDKGLDVEVDAPVPGAAGGTTPPPPVITGTPPAGVGPTRLVLHQAADVNQLGNIPTSAGSNLDTMQVEVGGITTIKHTYQVSGGFEADIKLTWVAGKALLISFHAANQQELSTFNEILESFGFSIAPSPAPSP